MRYPVNMIRWIGLVGWLVLLVGCRSQGSTEELPPYNSYVEAFTTGKVSRFSPVYLVLNEDIPDECLKADRLRKLMRLQPDAAGSWDFEDNHTLVFKPEKGFERNTTYRVTADLSEWFDIQAEEERQFAYSFTTLPLALRGNLESMAINRENENGYDFTFRLFTPDREQPETVESLVAYSERVNAVWKHEADGKRHQVTLTNLPAGTDGERAVRLSVAPNKWDLREGSELAEAKVPDQNDFSLYEVRYVTDPECFVEVSFTKTLDDTKDLRGLAFIADNSQETVTVEGNRLRLYPDAALREKGTMNVHINEGIRAKNGLTLPKPVVRLIAADERKPHVRFVGKGVIIPRSEELSVPFQAIYLRGVTVSVIKILERNIGQFLQTNNLDESSELMRVGRLVARKTIFLDEEGLDLSQWNTFAIDLRRMIEPEPGAIYRLELSFDRQLSAYPCGNDTTRVSKERILADDELRFKEEAARFDEGGYYYYRQYDWSDYDWNRREDPCSDSYYYNKVEGKNVLATNLGLTALMGEDNRMIALVHDLRDTSPVRGVAVTVYNYQHQPLASGETDERGRVDLDLSAGRPFYLIASRGDERSYLRVDDGSALSLSSFDVSGEVVQKGIKGFIYGERGVWRPGDTVRLGFMLSDRAKQLPARHPVVMELYNPLGQLYARQTRTRGELGLYTFAFVTEVDAPTGAWSVKAQVGGVSFSKRLRLETIKPNRLKIDLALPGGILPKGEELSAKLHTEWLQGAVARELRYDIKGTFVATPTTFDHYENYVFDDPSRSFQAEEVQIASGRTDERGDAAVRMRLELGASAPGLLQGSLVTRVFEESGEFSVDAARVRYSPYRYYAGIRSPQRDKSPLATGKAHTFEALSVDYQGVPQPSRELEVCVYKTLWHWWWDSDQSGLANYTSNTYNKPVKRLSLRTGADGRAPFQLSFPDKEWGTYFITVKDRVTNHSAGVVTYFDWVTSEERLVNEQNDAATRLVFRTDKERYAPGEQLTVTFPSTEGCRAIVSVENGARVLSLDEYACADRQTTVRLKVTKEMQPNAYLHITLLQPHGRMTNDVPIRLYGVVPFKVTSEESRLRPVIHAPAEIKPEAAYTISVSERRGREMAYTLAIVDEGLLDLTRFRTPDPWQAFNAREALGVNTWDLYNLVVGAYGGRIEQLFSIGGDDALNRGPKAIVNRFKPVTRFEGPFRLKAGETARHTYTMPNYQGRVRVMVVAGDGEAYGEAEQRVQVRKPVMLLGTLPRVIGVGEEMEVPATVFATENGVGEVTVSLSCGAGMEVVGSATRTLRFERIGDQQARFRVRVKDKPGVGKVKITARGQGEGRSATYQAELEIRSARRSQIRVTAVSLVPGASWKGAIDRPGPAGTNRLSLELSAVEPLNLTSRLSYLGDYPHECLEQITSRAFPLLYLSAFTQREEQAEQDAAERVKEVIRRLRSYQMADGAFSYWPGGNDSHGWGTAYAVHFLTDAVERGYLVPEAMRQSALNYLGRAARGWQAVATPYRASEEATQAYRLYVLALAQSPELGAMNRLRETSDLSMKSRWLLASAYALAGRTDVAAELVSTTSAVASASSFEYDETFGSETQEAAIRLMALCLLNRGEEAADWARKLSGELSSDEWLSTQSTAFALVALSDYMRRYPVGNTMDFSYNYGGKAVTEQVNNPLWSHTLPDKASGRAELALTNRGTTTLFARIIAEGTPLEGKESPYAHDVRLAVSYVDLQGKPIDVSELEQGKSFTAVVTVQNPSSRNYNNLVVSELFPAGWEILNSRFLPGAVDSLTVGVNYQDIRDDRVYSYIDRLPAGKQVTLRVNLCAVYPGRFYLPAVYVEAMYDHLVRANTEGREVRVR